MHTDHNAAPLNPLPPVVWLLVVPMALIEMTFSLGAQGVFDALKGARLGAVQSYAFYGAALDQMIANRYYPADQLVRFVTYSFVHGSFTQALFAIVFVLALGKMVGEVFKAWAVLAVFFGAAIVGALAYGLILNDPAPLLGGFPAAYGLIGAFTFLLWVNLAAKGANKYRAFTLIGFLLLIQLLFGVLFGGSSEWIADLAGFATGFLLSFVVSPGGWQRALQQLRRR